MLVVELGELIVVHGSISVPVVRQSMRYLALAGVVASPASLRNVVCSLNDVFSFML